MMKGKDYCITKENIKSHELIGLDVCVVESNDSSRIGVKGKVIDETLNTLKILDEGKEKILPKKECVFEFDIGEKVIVNGKDILKRSEDRTKEMNLDG